MPTEDRIEDWAAEGAIDRGEKLVREGKVREAIDAFQKAQQFESTWKIPQLSWNSLCWYGALYKEAQAVLSACDAAVKLDPANVRVRDSRGVAWALAGDIPGAIEDFQVFIKGTDWEKGKQQRQRWVEALKKGENPLTEEELDRLLESETGD